jgi:hypothetical protein
VRDKKSSSFPSHHFFPVSFRQKDKNSHLFLFLGEKYVMGSNNSQEQKQKTTTKTTRRTKLSTILLTSTVLLLSSMAAYGQPSPPTPQCKPDFTFNRGVCEQPATPFQTCPDDRDWTLEENEEGTLVCNLYTTVTDELQINEETGQVFCNDPFKPNPVEEPFECRYRYVTDTTKPITDFGCPNGGDLNRETNTCEMRPGHRE